MLIGQYISKLTEGNRISIPKKIREEVGDEFIVAKWYENCLVCVSKNDWQKLMARLIGKESLITSPVRDIDRFVLASAFEVSLDNQGRFVLPEGLKEYASLIQDCVFIGLGDRVEIWDQGKWNELEKISEEKAKEAIEKIAKGRHF